MIASSSDEELPDSYSIKLELPTELDNPDFSPVIEFAHIEFDMLLGDSGALGLRGGLAKRPFLKGKKLRDPTMGDDSGEDSARVE